MLLGGAAAAWPLAAYAQQGERMRRIGVLLPAAPEDAEFQSWAGAFLQGLARNRDGSPDAMYGSKLGGLNSTPKKLANMRPNWRRLYRTPSGDRQLHGATLVATDPHGAGCVSARGRSGSCRPG
jgi:hypothetical protein